MDLQRLAHLLRQSWLVLLIFIAAGVGLGAAQNQLSAPKYSSHTTLLFSLSGKGSLSLLADGSTYMQAMMPSYTKIIETPLVLDPVINNLGLGVTPKELSKDVTVDYQTDSVIADITVSNARAAQAASIADAIAQQVAVATSTLAPPGSDDLGLVSVTQISKAQPATSPYSPRLLPHLVVGLLGGLVLGIAVIWLREAIFSSAVNTREAVARATSAPLLGTFPLDPKARSRPLPADTQPMLPRSESFRFMQSNLAHVVRGPKLCLVVTSPRPDEGRTTTAANLAISIALANANRRVLLIDADLRSADIDDLLGVYSSLGLTSVVTNRTPLDEAVVPWTLHRADDPQIHFLAAGPPVPEPSDLLASESMSRVIREAREQYDVVILDSAPLLDVTDGAILAAQSDGAVIVVDAQKTRHRHLTESLNRLRLAGAHVIGVVLNRMPEAKEARRQGAMAAGHDINVRKRAPIYPLGEDETGADGAAGEGGGLPGFVTEQPDRGAHPRTPNRLVTPNGGSSPFAAPGRSADGPFAGDQVSASSPGAAVNLFPQMLPVRKPADDLSPPTRPTDLTELIDPSVLAEASRKAEKTGKTDQADKTGKTGKTEQSVKGVKRPSPYQGNGERPGQSEEPEKSNAAGPSEKKNG